MAHQRQRVAAYALILRGNDEILLCRLSDKVPNHGGRWTLPGGGLEFGESPVDAMVREVEEETGLIVRAGEVAGINSALIEKPTVSYHNIRIVFRAEVLSGTLRNETNGTTAECAWCRRDELPPLVSLAQYGVNIAFGDEHS